MRQAVLVSLLVGPVFALLAPGGDRPKGGRPKGDRLAKPVQVEVEGKPLVRERGGLYPFVGDFYGDGRLALLLGYGGDCMFEEGRSPKRWQEETPKHLLLRRSPRGLAVHHYQS